MVTAIRSTSNKTHAIQPHFEIPKNKDDWSKEVDVTANKCMFFLGNRPLSSKTKETEDARFS